jgi:hypothetical protein
MSRSSDLKSSLSTFLVYLIYKMRRHDESIRCNNFGLRNAAYRPSGSNIVEYSAKDAGKYEGMNLNWRTIRYSEPLTTELVRESKKADQDVGLALRF